MGRIDNQHVRTVTKAPALLTAILSIALMLLAVAFGYAALQQLGQECPDCPIDRSRQFAMVFFEVCVLLIAVAAVHAIVSVGIWRARRWAILFGLAGTPIGIAAMLWFARAPAYAVWFFAAAITYGVVLICLVCSVLRGGLSMKAK